MARLPRLLTLMRIRDIGAVLLAVLTVYSCPAHASPVTLDFTSGVYSTTGAGLDNVYTQDGFTIQTIGNGPIRHFDSGPNNDLGIQPPLIWHNGGNNFGPNPIELRFGGNPFALKSLVLVPDPLPPANMPTPTPQMPPVIFTGSNGSTVTVGQGVIGPVNFPASFGSITSVRIDLTGPDNLDRAMDNVLLDTQPAPPPPVDRRELIRDILKIEITPRGQQEPTTGAEGPVITAKFKQKDGIQLDDLRELLGGDFKDFNFVNVITADPVLFLPRDFLIPGPSGTQRRVGDALAEFYGSEDRIPKKTPHIDPQPGQPPNKSSIPDGLQWYWNPISQGAGDTLFVERYLQDADNDGKSDTLSFHDNPRRPFPFNVDFATFAVGIFEDPTKGEFIPGTLFKWRYDSLTGEIELLNSVNPGASQGGVITLKRSTRNWH